VKNETIALPNPALGGDLSYQVQGHKRWRVSGFTLTIATVTATRLIVRVQNQANVDRMISVGTPDLIAAATVTACGGVNLPATAFQTGNENVVQQPLPDLWHTIDGTIRITQDAGDGQITDAFLYVEYDD
jgi:hypothetical protein